MRRSTIITSLLAGAVGLLPFAPPAFGAASGSTPVTIQVTSGTLDISVPAGPVSLGTVPAQAIDRYLRARRGHKLAHTSPMLWLGELGLTFGYQGMSKALKLRADAAGIAGFHMHRLRHSFASRWLEAGGSEDGLMSVAGWSSREMIQIYSATGRSRRAMEEAKRLGLDKF